MATPDLPPPRRLSWEWVLPVLTLVFSLALTAGAYRLGTDSVAREQDAQLARLSERVLAMLRSRVDSASQAVHAARGHLAADGPRTLGAWKTFTDSEMAEIGRAHV